MTPRPRAPDPEGLNLEFYEHAADGTLHIQQCSACGRFRHPPRYHCVKCLSAAYRWTPSEGRGRLFTWTITHFPYDRGWSDDLPYATAVIELEEGVRLLGAFAGSDFTLLQRGLEMVARVDTVAHGFPFVTVEPASRPAQRTD